MATVVAGSYERFIWGFELKNSQVLKPFFSFPSHLGPIKSVAVSGPVAVSGGSDDAIKIYDLSTSSEIGSLHHHSAAVTSLSFFSPPSLSFPRNLLSASDDGSVCIFDADPFVLLKSIPAHRRPVSDLALHPSGRLALTVSLDASLAMINLVRGRRSFCCRLDRPASLLRFSCGASSGDRFFMASDEMISAHNSEDARLLFESHCPKRVLCLAPALNGLLFSGGEDHNITAWDTMTGKIAYCIEDAHTSRVKGIVTLGSGGNREGDELPYLLASASTDGVIRVWDVRMAKKEMPNPVAEVNTKSRLTCLAGSSSKSFRVGDSIPSKEQDANE